MSKGGSIRADAPKQMKNLAVQANPQFPQALRQSLGPLAFLFGPLAFLPGRLLGASTSVPSAAM